MLVNETLDLFLIFEKNKTECPQLLKDKMFWNFEKNVYQFTQKVDEPKKKLGILSCSVKNRTECPQLLKDKMFWFFEKNVNQFTQKNDEPKKNWASYSAQLRTGQNAHICWKLKCFEILKKCQSVNAKSWWTKKKWGTLSCSVKNRTECP